MKTLFQNPFNYWILWLFKKWSLEFKYRKQHLKLEYMVEITNCKFNNYNTIYKYARLLNSEIGDYSYVARNSQIYNTKIGKFTCIGPNVNTGMGAHPSSEYVSSHPLFYSTLGQASGLTIVDKTLFEEHPTTEIGNDVWIGNNVNIKYGIKIGDGAIIGTGALVTKDVEPYSIVGGVPAKLIKYRFSENEIKNLQELKWWNNDLQWIKENKHEFKNIKKFIEKHHKK